MRASSSDRAISCPASLALPQDERVPNEARDKAAAFGTLAHYWKETGQTDMPGASKADILLLEKKVLMSGIVREEWWPEADGEHEVTFALNIDDHEVRWFEGNKADGDTWKATFYPNPRWITGTADWAVTTPPRGILIGDLKTGRWPVSAVGNKQLLTYALPFWLYLGSPLKCAVELEITQWPKYPLADLPKRNWWRGVTGLDMMMHLQDLRFSLDNPKEANPSIEACRFCDCKNNCPDFLASGISYGRH